jgi:hypothetical protein
MEMSLLEDMTEHLGSNVFLRTFSFSSTQLPVLSLPRPQLADHVVLLEGLGFIFRLVERDADVPMRLSDLDRWFAEDVVKEGVRQITHTRELLRGYTSISLANADGHRLSVTLSGMDRLTGLILYRSPSRLAGFVAPRFRKASGAGFVHIMSDADYFGACDYLVTPSELGDYLKFREEVLSRPILVPPAVTEAALVGQYLFDDLDEAPDPRYESAARSLRGDPCDYVFTYVIENLATHISRRDEDSVESIYHPILLAIARLGRTELRELKTQLRLCLEAVRGDKFELPYRLCSESTNCAFLTLPGSAEFRLRSRKALETLAAASKYELQMEKQVSIAMWRSGEIIDIDWIYSEGPNPQSDELDRLLEEAYPFRRSSQKRLPEYYL